MPFLPADYRPVSPPPRQPSPEPCHTPLAPPRRMRTSSNTTSRLGRSKPASVESEKPTIGISEKAKASLWADSDEFGVQRPIDTPRIGAPIVRRGHRASVSSVRSHSPPPSPTIAAPPPVPLVPSYILQPSDKKPVLHPHHIFIPEFSVPSDADRRPKSPKRKKQGRFSSDAGISCLRFFSLRHSRRRSSTIPR